jgi:hypothetical protein
MNQDRKMITVDELRRMLPEERDKLPSPAAHKGVRRRWVGIGWVDEGEADGTEPLVLVGEGHWG